MSGPFDNKGRGAGGASVNATRQPSCLACGRSIESCTRRPCRGREALPAACPDLDGCRERMESEGCVPLDVDRLTRVLRAIHGDNVPFPRVIPTTPREYAERIVAMDARLSQEQPK